MKPGRAGLHLYSYSCTLASALADGGTAVSSVFGVKAVAEELEVRYPFEKRRKTMRTSPSGRSRFSLGISKFPTTK
jgi:hypothetical protein